MKSVPADDLPEILLQRVPLIDVRAPVEFALGSLPGAINLPLLNDEERALVGTTYKQEGQDAAIRLGNQLVRGPVKEARRAAWLDALSRHPESIIYCFRGGLRSQTVQTWVAEAGLERPLLKGGFKEGRRFLRSVIDEQFTRRSFWVLAGPTGSGKTELLAAVSSARPTLDLEEAAAHRGSAFGNREIPQPSVVDFEHALALQLLKIRGSGEQPWLLEDESRMIGRLAIPPNVHAIIQSSPLILLEEPRAARVERIYRQYILESAIAGPLETKALAVFAEYERATKAIEKRLGGLRTQEILRDIGQGRGDFLAGRALESNRTWIEKLLEWYYDPLYLRGLEKRTPKVIFRGSWEDARQFLSSR